MAAFVLPASVADKDSCATISHLVSITKKMVKMICFAVSRQPRVKTRVNDPLENEAGEQNRSSRGDAIKYRRKTVAQKDRHLDADQEQNGGVETLATHQREVRLHDGRFQKERIEASVNYTIEPETALSEQFPEF